MRISRLKLMLLVAMSVFGLWAAGMVLVVYYFLGQSLPVCTASQPFFGLHIDCNAVLGSKYSQVFGIPLEVFAVAYFIVNLLLVSVIAFGGKRSFGAAVNILFVWRFIGVLIVPYLIFVEVLLLNAICLYCTMMHIAIIADFIVISYLLFYRKESLFESALQSDALQPAQPTLEEP